MRGRLWGRAAILLWLLCNTGSDKLPKWLIVLHPEVVDWGIKLLTKEPHQTQLRLLYVSLFAACMRTNCVAKGLIHSDWLTGIPAELISRPTGGFVLYVHTYVHTCGSLWCNYMYVCMYVCMYVHTLPPNRPAKTSPPPHPPTSCPAAGLPLFCVGLHLLQKNGMVDFFKLDVLQVMKFLCESSH